MINSLRVRCETSISLSANFRCQFWAWLMDYKYFIGAETRPEWRLITGRYTLKFSRKLYLNLFRILFFEVYTYLRIIYFVCAAVQLSRNTCMRHHENENSIWIFKNNTKTDKFLDLLCIIRGQLFRPHNAFFYPDNGTHLY